MEFPEEDAVSDYGVEDELTCEDCGEPDWACECDRPCDRCGRPDPDGMCDCPADEVCPTCELLDRYCECEDNA